MKQRIKDFWAAFKDIAIVFSFVVNLILVLVLLIAIIPLLQLKSSFLEPLLNDLDQAFLGLAETQIDTVVNVDQTIPIRFTLPLSQPLPLDFDLPINQATDVILRDSVPLQVQASFVLPGGGGSINGTVSLALPAGMRLPVNLEMVVPVETTIPVVMNVPVDQMVPIQMEIPVQIPLGEAGLDPAVQELRDVFTPLNVLLDKIPDIGPR